MDVDSVLVGCVPAACMLACTALGLRVRVPEDVAGALQHFAAGLLLAAIGCELLPVLLWAEGWRANLFATVGFFAGMAVLIVIGAVLPEEYFHDDNNGGGDDEDDDDDGHLHEAPPKARGLQRQGSVMESLRGISSGERSLLSKSKSKRELAKSINEAYCNTCDTIVEENWHGHPHEAQPHEAQPLVTKEPVAPVGTSLPLPFLAATVVDSFMDGFLLGITSVAGKGALIIMAGSLSVEMSFVGLTLATACHGMPLSRSVPAALAGPLVLVLGAVVGGLVTGVVAGDPALMAGIMGFGTSALLFMVAEELLLEAHEEGEHVWWVDSQLYVGFYWGFMSSKFLPE